MTVTRMAEYIEREALLKFIENGINNPDRKEAFGYDAVEILGKVQYMPAADVAPVRRWIPVAERLPEKNKEVVGWYKDNPFSPFRYGIVSWNGHGWVFTYAQRYVDAVTHWMPLPEPPKEETP